MAKLSFNNKLLFKIVNREKDSKLRLMDLFYSCPFYVGPYYASDEKNNTNKGRRKKDR